VHAPEVMAEAMITGGTAPETLPMQAAMAQAWARQESGWRRQRRRGSCLRRDRLPIHACGIPKLYRR